MSEVDKDRMIELLLPISGVGDRTAETIAEAFHFDLDAFLNATDEELLELDGVGTTTARAIRRRLSFIKKYGAHRPVEVIEHKDRRKNIPTDQQSQLMDVRVSGEPDLALYPRDPELDPQLVWQGKGELDGDDLAVPVVPVYIQEKLLPQAIVENLRKTAEIGKEEPELSLFDDFDGLSDDAVLDFYQHEANWSNRMILGDALVAMTSLAEKENIKGKVQTVYIDPPYGIRFQSNWQVSTRDRSVTDGLDISRQPEQVRAFRDTWDNGIHSYLSYLRDRLQAAQALLDNSGSVFVQIGDDNLHVVRCLLDEIFGPANFVSVIVVQKTMSATANELGNVADFILWYARDRSRMKYRQLYKKQVLGGENVGTYTRVELPDGTERSLTRTERAGIDSLPEGSRIFGTAPLTSARRARSGDLYEFEYEGRVYTPGAGTWKTNREGMDRLVAAGRIHAT